eukprot:TRINITY_DN1441_c0_g1_i2.p1 TRINITY_DN1441_c0_g1~~TRINITY_DN1441_c0_g1_i2.p1  ORF type:complete len:558 (+),score=137.27 TRINITY_DN1441_c0_g1_i2:62-1735(+)
MSEKDLILYIIQSTFGEMVKKVTTPLVLRGKLSFNEILAETDCSEAEVKQALKAGITHNFVFMRGKKNPRYFISKENVLFRIRLPQCFKYIQNTLGSDAERIVRQMALLGRCTVSQVVGKNDKIGQKALNNVMRNQYVLVVDKIIEDAQKIDKQNDLVLAKALRRASFMNDEDLADMAEAEKGNKMQQLKEKKRKLLTSTPPPPPPKKKKKAEKTPTKAMSELEIFQLASSTSKTEENQIAVEENESTVDLESSTLWCLNPYKFNREFRKQLITSYIMQRFEEPLVVDIASASMFLSERKGVVDKNETEPMSFKELDEYIKKKSGSKENHKLQTFIDMMKNTDPPLINSYFNIDVISYSLSTGEILNKVKEAVVTSIVLDKYHDPDYLRIMRILFVKHVLEEKQITELALIPPQIVQQCLFNLLDKNYVKMIELPSGSRDRNCVLWSANIDTVAECMLEDVYHAIINLSKRLHHQHELQRDLLARKEEEERLLKAGNKIQILSQEERVKLSEMAEATLCLENAIIQCDKILLILSIKNAEKRIPEGLDNYDDEKEDK